MADVESTNLTPKARPVLLTYKKKKPLSSSPPTASQQLAKRIGNIPDLSLCHCCGLNYQNPNSNPSSNPIYILKSAWRILLLCETCLGRVKSGEICSYCFQNEPDDVVIGDDVAKLESVNCFKCSRRVHFCCIPREHHYDFATWQHYKKGSNGRSFTCIDCLPVPKLLSSNKNMSALKLISNKEKVDSVATSDLLEKRVDDKDLAMQLHLEMNGSQRVSRNKVNAGLVSALGKTKRSKIELYRKRLSHGSTGIKNIRITNARFSGVSCSSNRAVLALPCTNCVFESLSELRVRSRFSKKYGKSVQVQNGNDDSKANSENGRDKYEKKYTKKKERLSVVSGSNSGSQSESGLKIYAKRKTYEGMAFPDTGSQNGSNQYGYKYYKRRSCLENLVDSNASQNRFKDNVALKQNIADRFINKYFKRRLIMKREDGTCVGTCTVYKQDGSDRYLKKYTKTRKRKAGSGGEQYSIDRYMKKYSKRRLNIEGMAVTEESQYGGRS